MVQIKAPQFPESIADGEVATWHVAVGEPVQRDQVLVDIETDKVVLEVVAPSDGTLTAILKAEGETVLAEEVLGDFEPGEITVEAPAQAAETTEPDVNAGALPDTAPPEPITESIASPAVTSELSPLVSITLPLWLKSGLFS